MFQQPVVVGGDLAECLVVKSVSNALFHSHIMIFRSRVLLFRSKERTLPIVEFSRLRLLLPSMSKILELSTPLPNPYPRMLSLHRHHHLPPSPLLHPKSMSSFQDILTTLSLVLAFNPSRMVRQRNRLSLRISATSQPYRQGSKTCSIPTCDEASATLLPTIPPSPLSQKSDVRFPCQSGFRSFAVCNPPCNRIPSSSRHPSAL